MKERVGEEEIGFEEVKFGSQAFCVGQIRGIVVKEFGGTFFQVLNLANLEIYFL